VEISRKFLYDRLVLLLITLLSALTAVGVCSVLIRFDVSKNPTTTAAYRQNLVGIYYQSGKPIDIYILAIFMILTAGAGMLLAYRVYNLRRQIAIMLLTAANFLLIISIIVANALISIQ
jgi:hypothetical protein